MTTAIAPDFFFSLPPSETNPADPRPPRPTNVGGWITFYRGQRGWSQAELARRTRGAVSQSTVSLVEAGQRDPQADTVREIARALDVPVGALFGEPLGDLSPAEATYVADLRLMPDAVRDEVRDFMRRLLDTRSGEDQRDDAPPDADMLEPPAGEPAPGPRVPTRRAAGRRPRRG